jgi:hypothetical protein
MDHETDKQKPSSTEGGKMSERKYRTPTEADIGERIEVTDDWSIAKGIIWHRRTLLEIVCASYPFVTDTGAVWRYARIEVQGE